MKKMKLIYESPALETMEFRVEAGIAESPDPDANILDQIFFDEDNVVIF